MDGTVCVGGVGSGSACCKNAARQVILNTWVLDLLLADWVAGLRVHHCKGETFSAVNHCLGTTYRNGCHKEHNNVTTANIDCENCKWFHKNDPVVPKHIHGLL